MEARQIAERRVEGVVQGAEVRGQRQHHLLYSILYTVYCILHTTYCILYTIYYTIYFAILCYTIPYHIIVYNTRVGIL